jgi:glycerophosphoryl diester phosphodiesterase
MPKLIAHRGASSEAPENTLASIRRAIELSVDYIEIDVHLTKDHVPVVIHDSTTQRTAANSEHAVEETTLSDLKKLEVGSWFSKSFDEERIPTLREVLDLDFKGAALMIEIKKSVLPARLVTHAVVEEIHRTKNYASLRHCIGSFNPEIIKEIKKRDQQLELIGIVENSEGLNAYLKMKLPRIALWHQTANEADLKILKELGVPAWVYTVDDPDLCRHLLEQGYDGIITNNPAVIGPLINKFTAQIKSNLHT